MASASTALEGSRKSASVAGRSHHENYLLADEQAARAPIIATLQKENPDHDVYNAILRGIQVGNGEPGSELKFAAFSREQRRYTGVLEWKQWDDLPRVLVRAGNAVVEIPFTKDDLEFRRLEPGITVTITMLDELPTDLDAPTGFVGRREHVDRDDAIDDAHTSLQTLVKIEAGEDVLFDRTVCRVHQTQMQLSSVPVAYGILMTSRAERYCRDHFPHAKAFARGGCLVMDGEPEFTPVYQCAKCVTACAEYAASQPAVAHE